MDEIRYWIETEGTGHWFFIVFPVIFLCLLIWFNGRRVKFLIPSLLIMLVILNPLFYKKWNGLGLYAYWRILWVIPVIPIIAAVVPSICEKIKKSWIKISAVIIGAGLIIFGGTFLYNGTGGNFVDAANAAKLPDSVVEISDYLLSIDKHPRVVAQDPLGTYMRQYTGEIDLLYGRNMNGYILTTTEEAKKINDILNGTEDNMEYVGTIMANDQYDYLIVDDRNREEIITEAGFVLLNRIAGYSVYKSESQPTVIKERDELGQLVSITSVNEEGESVNGSGGYSTVSFNYDENGNIIRRFQINTDGVGVANGEGIAGYEREYDNQGHMIKEIYIDAEGKPIKNGFGYAELRREYIGSDIVKESYYDEIGDLVNRIDVCFAIKKIEYNRDKTEITEIYYGTDEKPVESSMGYSMVKRINGNDYYRESYYDTAGNPCEIIYGYSSYTRKIDQDGIETTIYLGTDNEPINCINGYAKMQKTYDKQGNLIVLRYEDADGKATITGDGFAEIHRIFDGTHLISEEYYGTMKEPLAQVAGHVAFKQEWDGDNLVSRSYLNSDGQLINRVDGYTKVVWDIGETCLEVKFYDTNNLEQQTDALNLVQDVHYDLDGWSNWIIPEYNVVNSCQNIGHTNLGKKTDGQLFTCYIEIEFKGVKGTQGHQFGFVSQGAQDGKWFTGNVWNDKLVNLVEPPEDGIYTYVSTVMVSGSMIDVSTFNIDFRCDYWSDGAYRIRNVKIAQGDNIAEWSPGL